MTSLSTETALVEKVILNLLRGNGPEVIPQQQRIRELMLCAFKAAGKGWLGRTLFWTYAWHTMTRQAQQGAPLEAIARRLETLLSKVADREKVAIPRAIERARRIANRVQPYLLGEHILDLGAGNGLVGQMLHDRTGFEVLLLDVLDYSLAQLPLQTFREGEPLPLPDKAVDTTILYVVLHHSDDPLFLLREAVRVTRQRLIIMEGYVDRPGTREVNSFIDWFFSRVVQGLQLNLPLNYRTTDEWQAAFDALGLSQKVCEVLGVDEPLGPEEHVFYVLDR